MKFERVFIPYGAYWSTPFCKWQGSFAALHSLKFAAQTAARALEERQLSTEQFTGLSFGNTIPAPQSFYGAPWLATLLGAPSLTGPTISQACATSARVVAEAALRVEVGGPGEAILTVTADRTSNGPHLVYPGPTRPGGTLQSENWVWDNFNCDPSGGNSMLETAENVAREEGIGTEEQHEIALLRYQQYQQALEDEAAFQKRFMIRPIEVNPSGRKVTATVDGDEGVVPTSAEALSRLRPVLPEGTVTFGGQTYPADGNAGLVVAGRDTARALSRSDVEVRILAVGESRTRQGFMPEANLGAVDDALRAADLGIDDIAAIKTHNPFAVNDILLARRLGLAPGQLNNYGCSLIWGHPQGPTGMRLLLELIEELEIRGGGCGLMTGCAAGDSSMAVVVRVGDPGVSA